MFTRRDTTAARSPLADIKPVDRMTAELAPDMMQPRSAPAGSGPAMLRQPNGAGAASGPSSGPGMASFAAGSIIGNDLTIMGQGLRIVTRGRLQVDGRIEGDVVGQEVIVGEKGHVTGVVSGESVIVRGAVSGTVKGMTVVLQASAHVEGDVHHRELAVEQGAHLDGRVRRPTDLTELKPDLGPALEPGA